MECRCLNCGSTRRDVVVSRSRNVFSVESGQSPPGEVIGVIPVPSQS